jgi:hypothetical protein
VGSINSPIKVCRIYRNEGLKVLKKAIRILRPIQGDPRKLAFVMRSQTIDLITHIAIPPAHANVEYIFPKDYQMKEILLGKVTWEMTKVLTTIGLKQEFWHLDEDEASI